MKKYTKPSAEVVELSVKEPLSALPGDLQRQKVQRTTAYAATFYGLATSEA